jgi:O-antigen ligase
LATWLVWSTVGAVLSPQPGTSMLAIAGFAACGIAAASVGRRMGLEGVVSVMSLGLAFSLAMAFVAAGLGRGGGIGDRLQLLFLEPNQLARACALVIVGAATVAVHRVAATCGFDRRALMWLMLGSSAVIGLILTRSRTGVAAAVLGVLVVGALQLPHRRALAVLAGLTLATAAGATIVLAGAATEDLTSTISRNESANPSELTTLNGRTVLWPEVFDVAAETPLVGIGLGRDRIVVAPFRAQGRVTWDAEHTHSLPLQLLLTTGVPGLVLVSIGVSVITVAAWRAPFSPSRTWVLATVAVIVVDGIVEPTLRVPTIAWFALCAAATLSAVWTEPS